MLKIYHSPGTRGFRTIWICEELGVDYEIVPVDFSAGYRESAQWRAINPVGKVPAMALDDLVMFESCAMMQYVLDRFGDGQLQPSPGSTKHAHYLQWCWFSEATFARPLGEIVNHRRNFSPDIDAVVDEMKGRASLCVQAIDDALNGRDYLLGNEFCAADLSVGYVLRGYQRMVTDELPSNVARFFQRVAARPAYQKTLEADKQTADKLRK